MNRKITSLLFLMALLLTAQPSDALDFWQYPEMAERHALFIGVFAARFDFTDYFTLWPPEIIVDYLLPFGLPFSVGTSIRAFDSSLYGFSLRLGYHVNFDNEFLDVYFLYNTALVFSGDYIWLELSPRIGFRRRFSIFCFTIEAGSTYIMTDPPNFNQFNIFFGISLKIN